MTYCSFYDNGGLFITNASLDLDAKGHELQRLAGGLFDAETSSSAQAGCQFRVGLHWLLDLVSPTSRTG